MLLLRSVTRSLPSVRNYATAPAGLELELRTALKVAMKARESFRVTVIKSILADLQTASHTPSPPSPFKSLSRAISTRTEAAATFLSSGRSDLSTQYLSEVAILQEFQPSGGGSTTNLSEVELEESVRSILKELGVEERGIGKEMGRVMKECVKRLEGKAEGKDIAMAVRRLSK